MWGQRSLALRPFAPSVVRLFTSDSVFVRNLAVDVTEDDLKHYMEQSGQVLSCIIPESFGQKKGYGLVQFSSSEEAQKAIAELNESTFFNNVISVAPRREPQIDRKKLFVTDLPKTTFEELQEFFSQYGTVTSCQIFTLADQTKAVIEFESEETVQSLLEQELTFNDLAISLKPFIIKRNRQTRINTDYKIDDEQASVQRKVYVSNIPSGVEYPEISDIFKSVGKVKFTRILRDKFSGESKGTAIVEYFDEASASTAVNKLNNFTVNNSNIRVKPFRPRQV